MSLTAYITTQYNTKQNKTKKWKIHIHFPFQKEIKIEECSNKASKLPPYNYAISLQTVLKRQKLLCKIQIIKICERKGKQSNPTSMTKSILFVKL